MNSKFKVILISLLFTLSIVFSFSMSTKVSALNLVGVETANNSGGGGSIGIVGTSINQAYFRYDGTDQENSWLSKAGIGAPKRGALVLIQWINGNGGDHPLDWLKEFYSYSNVVTTNYYTDYDPMANRGNWDEMLRLASSESQPNQLALAGGVFGIGNNVIEYGVGGAYAVTRGPFWFSGTYGDGATYNGYRFTPGNGNGSGAGGNFGQNQMGAGVVFQGGRLIKSIVVDSPIDLPTNQAPVKPTATSGIQKSITDVTTNKTSSDTLKSKSSTDQIKYNLGFTYSSSNKNTYYNYAWTNGNKDAFTTSTIEQSFQSVSTVTDTLPKGYALDGVKISTQDGRSLDVVKVDNLRTDGVRSDSLVTNTTTNVTAGTGKDYAYYFVAPGETGNKVTIIFVAGDSSEVATEGRLNRANVEFSGKLIPGALPTPDQTTGVGRLTNTADVSQEYHEYNRVHTSGGGSKPQPYTFGGEGYGSPRLIEALQPKKSNAVNLDVQSYRLTTNYLQYTKDYIPTGWKLNVNINGTQASKWVSPWTYPTLTTTTPIPESEQKVMDSKIFDFNLPNVTSNGASGTQTGVNTGGSNVVDIPNTTTTPVTVSKTNSIISSGTYTGTWYHKVKDLQGNVHNNDQLTTLADGKTSKIDVTPNEHTYTVGDSDAVLNLYYGTKQYTVLVKHLTSASSDPSNVSFDKGSNPIVSGKLNVSKSIDDIQTDSGPHVERYYVHEGETFQYTPQVQTILQTNGDRFSNWELLESLNKPHVFKFDSGSEPTMVGSKSELTHAIVGLQYDTGTTNLDISLKAMVNINPDDFTIITGQKSNGLNFVLNLSGRIDANARNFINNNTPGFNLSNYRYLLNISDGKNIVYTSNITAADFTLNKSNLTKQISGVLLTKGYSDGAKTKFKVSLTPDSSLLKYVNYVPPGSTESSPIKQSESTDTDLNHTFDSYGFTASNAVINNKDLNKDGQLNIDPNKLVIKTYATRKPYTYKEYHEYWDVNFPSDVNTLTGYSINGSFPIKYGVDDESKMNPFDLNKSGQFKIKYPTGLNEDVALLPNNFDTTKVTLDSGNLSTTVDLNSTDVKKVTSNGITTSTVVPSTPNVKVELKTGKISSDPSKLSNSVRDGGNRIYISNWITNVPSKQIIKFQSNTGMGQNNVSYDLSQNVTLIGYLQGHNESDTQSTDALLMQPVDRSQLFGNGRPFNYSTTDETWLKNSNWYK